MLKLSTYLFLGLLLLVLAAPAQKSEYTIEKLKSYSIQPDTITFHKSLPFRSVQIIDGRPDTTKVGFGMKWGHFQKVVVEGGATNRIQDLVQLALNSSIEPPINQSLLIVIRQLWVHEPSYKEQLEKNSNIAAHEQPSMYSECKSKLEVYMKKEDVYIPLFRIDSNFRFDHSIKNKGGSNIIAPFSYCLEKLSRLNYVKVAESSQRLSLSQIEAYNKKRVDQPIFSNTLWQRGIYLTYADFLNNKITTKEFVVELEDLTDQLYLVDNGQKRLFDDFWGFCDGKQLFVRSGFNYYPLVKQGNTYEFIGKAKANQFTKLIDLQTQGPLHYKSMTKRSTKNAMARMAGPNLNDGGYKPYQLDLESGSFF